MSVSATDSAIGKIPPQQGAQKYPSLLDRIDPRVARVAQASLASDADMSPAPALSSKAVAAVSAQPMSAVEVFKGMNPFIFKVVTCNGVVTGCYIGGNLLLVPVYVLTIDPTQNNHFGPIFCADCKGNVYEAQVSSAYDIGIVYRMNIAVVEITDPDFPQKPPPSLHTEKFEIGEQAFIGGYSALRAHFAAHVSHVSSKYLIDKTFCYDLDGPIPSGSAGQPVFVQGSQGATLAGVGCLPNMNINPRFHESTRRLMEMASRVESEATKTLMQLLVKDVRDCALLGNVSFITVPDVLSFLRGERSISDMPECMQCSPASLTIPKIETLQLEASQASEEIIVVSPEVLRGMAFYYLSLMEASRELKLVFYRTLLKPSSEQKLAGWTVHQNREPDGSVGLRLCIGSQKVAEVRIAKALLGSDDLTHVWNTVSQIAASCIRGVRHFYLSSRSQIGADEAKESESPQRQVVVFLLTP
jgi:hypothetical protein